MRSRPRMATPVRHVSELDLVPWLEGIHTFARYISPWLEIVDESRFQATVDRVEALRPHVIAGCHTPAIDRGYVADAIAATRTAPWATVPPSPTSPCSTRSTASSPRPPERTADRLSRPPQDTS